MKRLLATLLMLCMLFSITACGDETAPHVQGSDTQKTLIIYVVTEQKNYTNGELTSSATFQYDACGRPTVIERKQYHDDTSYGDMIEKLELTYDEHGNRIRQVYTEAYPDIDTTRQRQIDFALTYTNGALTHCDYSSGSENETFLGYDLQYDAQGRLIQVTYNYTEEEIEPSTGRTCWESYTYDKNGKLVAETVCTQSASGDYYMGITVSYSLQRVCYTYNEKGQVTERYLMGTRQDKPISPDEAEKLTYNRPSEQFYFYYDGKGKLARTASGAEYDHDGSSAAIYTDPQYTFDEHGNLLRFQKSDDNWVEYTYMAMEVRSSDAEMAKHLMHGIDKTMRRYMELSLMDPLYWTIGPKYLYYNDVCVNDFYYLVANPLWQLTR